MALLSNGAYHLLLDSAGHSRAMARETALYGGTSFREQTDLRAVLQLDGESCPLFPAASCEFWELGEERARWQGRFGPLVWESVLSVAGSELGERRSLSFHATGEVTGQLVFSLRPLLARPADYRAHPAFWTLGLEWEEAEGALLLHRLRRGAQPGLWLCLRADAPLSWRCDLRLPLVQAVLSLALRAGEKQRVTLVLCLAASRREALDGAARILRSGSGGSMVSAAATRLGLSAAEVGAAMALLPQLLTPPSQAAPRRELWPFGISGDYPLLALDARAVEALPLLKSWLLLKSCGLESDLVYLSEEQGEYRRPSARRITDALSREGLEALLGSRAGVHFVPMSGVRVVRSRASYLPDTPAPSAAPLSLPAPGRPRRPGTAPEHHWDTDAFSFTVCDTLPGRAWQLPLSNGHLGAIAADVGLAALWLDNAREQRLMPPMEEVRAIQPAAALQAQLGERAVSLFAANDGLRCTVRFAPGLAVWEKELAGRLVRTSAFIPAGTDALLLHIEGAGGLTLCFALQPLLGPDASSLRPFPCGDLTGFENPESYLPNLRFLVGCSTRAEAQTAFAPAAVQLRFQARDTVTLALGCCPDEALRSLLAPGAAQSLCETTRGFWRSLALRTALSVPHPAVRRYASTWAVYQALACRLQGRSSLYQSGGAIGFRDQLQDAVNLLPVDPALACERIQDACRHQYVEGDVMHWWHPHPSGDKGVRTRCSDDLLWLVWALCEYCEWTGDTTLCEQTLPYCSSPPLREDEHDRYEVPALSDNRSTVLDHARAALERCLARGFGPHGLPFFGSGDWNDGLDAVGGESVWLGWFLSHCCERFAALLDTLSLSGAHRWREVARQSGLAANAAWSGRWYYRGYTADGAVLGGPERIDSLPQSWAALSPYAEPARVDSALDAALERLVDEEHRLVKLFAPPFTEAEPYPGYLVSYGAAFRENGGQYTHAAVWLARALLRRGRRAEALRLLALLLPEGRDMGRYEAEPFVLAADVCAASGREGEAGWTWYTGSAGWYWRVLREWCAAEDAAVPTPAPPDDPAS